MKRNPARNRLCGIAAAIMGFAIMLAGGTAPGEAEPYTLNFTGTVTGAIGPLGLFLDNGDHVSGQLTFSTFNQTTFLTSSDGVFNAHSFFQSDDLNSGLTLTVTHDGTPLMTPLQAIGGGDIVSDTNGNISRLGFFIDNGLDNSLLFTASGRKQLTSLAGLPTTVPGLLALLGGTGGPATGTFSNGLGSMTFNIDAVAATPLPAALPLFLSAIGGLGFASWRRKSGATA